ncbi:hypothetical protein L6452_24411 [Arctium lappa]|uniref:Uncharacterized protein n=1 Tax=Arctium lappa TaxID=4217 RepID=A0ACB9AB48_ARCLA|nr:hypothetical protein L6452_24411 [Arctium lappa]
MLATSLAVIGDPLKKLWITFTLLIWFYYSLCCFIQHFRWHFDAFEAKKDLLWSGVFWNLESNTLGYSINLLKVLSNQEAVDCFKIVKDARSAAKQLSEEALTWTSINKKSNCSRVYAV